MSDLEHLFAYGVFAPPTVLILLCVAGATMALLWRRFGIAVALLASLCLFAAATPALSSYLLRCAEAGLPQNPDFRGAQAIVVLGGDMRFGNGGDIPDALGPLSIERLVLAAAAYRRLHLPVAVSGGVITGAHASEAALMKTALDREFAVPVEWSEDHSRTTWENAVFTARLLQADKLNSVVVVTQAWHLPRAVWCFERAGLTAVPWPVPRQALRIASLSDFLPSIAALHDTFYALHELIGSAYYRLRY